MNEALIGVQIRSCKGGKKLARHKFGIMQNAPKPRKRYDEYEPKKYNYISVDDDYIDLQIKVNT